MNELKQLYADKLITLKEFTKGLLLLDANSPIASHFIEALKLKSLKGSEEGSKEGRRK